MNQRLARPGGAADGELLQRPAVAAHGMALKVGQHQHGIVVEDVLAQVVLLQDFPVGDGPHHIGALGVQQVHGEVLVPAVLLYELEVGFRIVPHAAGGVAVSGVALHDGAPYRLYHGPPKLWAEEILVALLPGVDFDGHLAGQLHAQGAVQLHHFFGGQFSCKKHLCWHTQSLLVAVGRIPRGPLPREAPPLVSFSFSIDPAFEKCKCLSAML